MVPRFCGRCVILVIPVIPVADPRRDIVVDMFTGDPLQPLLTSGQVSALAEEASAAIAAVHRRPVSLRRADVTGSESVLRGARTSALLDDPSLRLADGLPSAVLGPAGLLAPDVLETSARTFGRAPLQILARMSVLAGSDGIPVGEGAGPRLQRLAGLIGAPGVNGVLLPQVVHAELLAHGVFGEQSGVIARAAARLSAVATGFDPRGLAVPEPHLLRHRELYRETLEAWAQGEAEPFLELALRAWIAGAAEAEAIAAAL